MSTNAIIGMVNPDKSVSSIYLHFDGYIAHAGVMLHTYYNSEKQAMNLIERGGLSSLNKKLVPDINQNHSFENPQPDTCVFYHRDRGEDLEIDKSLSESIFVIENKRSLIYLFKNGEWYINYGANTSVDNRMIPLKIVLQNNDLIEEKNAPENTTVPTRESPEKKKKPVIINFFGGPGSGKSTSAAFLFYQLKMAGYRCELVTEFAKDKTYEKNHTALADQIFVFANQNYRINQIIRNEELDVIITDSPLLLSMVHNNNPEIEAPLNDLIATVHNTHKNVNIFLKPCGEYQAYGRSESEDEANTLSDRVLELFESEMHLVTNKVIFSNDNTILYQIKDMIAVHNLIEENRK